MRYKQINVNNIKNKNVYFTEFDMLRGIAVVLVVLGHSFIGGTSQSVYYGYLHKFIYSFHMAVFFFISGFFASKVLFLESFNEKKIFIINKFKKLMIPYFTLSFLAIPIKLVMNSFINRPITVKEAIKDIFIYPLNNPVIALWFIYALTIMFFILLILNKLGDRDRIVIGIVLLLITGYSNITIFNLNGVFRNIIFFFIGLWVNKQYYKIKSTLKNYSKSIVLFTLINLLIINGISINDTVLASIVYGYTGICGILMTLIISINLDNKINGNILRCISYYSFDIYLFSWFSQNCIGYILYKVFNIDYGIIILITFLCGFLPILVSKYIVRKSKILSRFLLGI